MPSSAKRKPHTHTPSATSSSYRIPHLTPTTLSIPSSRVRKSWRPLPTQTQERIRALLLAIQSQTLAGLDEAASSSRGGGRGLKRLKALYKIPSSMSSSSQTTTTSDHEKAIHALIDKLLRSLPKMTFPPPTKTSKTSSARNRNTAAAATAAQDLDLSLSATLHRTSILAAQLSQATQSTKLLKAQIRAEEADLRKEREELRVLEANAKAAVAVDRGRRGRLHGLALLEGVGKEEEDLVAVKPEDVDEEGIYEAASTARKRVKGEMLGVGLSTAEVDADVELKTLADGVRSHLGSMRTNAKGLAGMKRELRRAEREVRRWGIGREVQA